ncbi:MAG: hypothetical protein COA84_11160 [Robiginitomaculum sp.]|nr:MAG: hypothetical protein COA84_11160 [Robiginitomaculum sp.]
MPFYERPRRCLQIFYWYSFFHNVPQNDPVMQGIKNGFCMPKDSKFKSIWESLSYAEVSPYDFSLVRLSVTHIQVTHLGLDFD